MAVSIDGERVVREALDSIREAQRTIRARQRGESFGAIPTSPTGVAVTERADAAPPIDDAVRARREQALRALQEGENGEGPERLYAETVRLRSELADDIENTARAAGIETDRSQISEATGNLQIEIKTIAVEIQGADAIADALGSVFEGFLSGIRSLLGLGDEATDTAANDSDPDDGSATPSEAPQPLDVGRGFAIELPANELTEAAVAAASADPANETAPPEAGRSPFAISLPGNDESAAAAAAASDASTVAPASELAAVAHRKPSRTRRRPHWMRSSSGCGNASRRSRARSSVAASRASASRSTRSRCATTRRPRRRSASTRSPEAAAPRIAHRLAGESRANYPRPLISRAARETPRCPTRSSRSRSTQATRPWAT